MTSLFAAIAAAATVVGGLVYVLKFTSWLVVKSPDAKDQDVEQKNAEEKKKAEEEGRPQ